MSASQPSKASVTAVKKTIPSVSSEMSVGDLSGPSSHKTIAMVVTDEHNGSTTEVESDTPVRKPGKSLLCKRSTAQSFAKDSECTSQITNGHSQVHNTRSSTGTRKRKKITMSSSSVSSSTSLSSNSDTEIEGVSLKNNNSRPTRKRTVATVRAPQAKPALSSSEEDSEDSHTECEFEEEKSNSEQEKLVRRSQRNTRNSNLKTLKRNEARKKSAEKPPRSKRPHVLYSEDEESDKAEVEPDVDYDDTDDEDYVLNQPKRRSVRETGGHNQPRFSSSQKNHSESSQQSRTRNRGQRTVHYQENSDDESSSSEFVTLSSRGRLRRLTPRARASLLGE